MNKGCCFTGHRRINAAELAHLENALDGTVEKLILRGVNTFYAGGAMGFDMLAAESVIRMKKKYPSVVLHLVLPCRDQCKNWNITAIKKYKYIMEFCDSFEYITDFYRDGVMHERNRRMIELSDICVSYVKHERGGSAYTIRYAQRLGLELISLAKYQE